MMLSKWYLISLAVSYAISAQSQVPDEETLKRELETIYSTQAAQPDLSHLTEEGRSLVPLMFDQGAYLFHRLKPWSKDPSALLLTDGNHAEHGIRPNTHTAFIFSSMYRCLDETQFPEDFTKDQCRDATIGILRFVLPTHQAGGITCSDDKNWYNQWQSAHWANGAGRAAWLMWDELDPKMQWLAARMICDEADRFIGKRPPSQVESDTKAEENAWNSTVISIAYNMFPNHPRHDAYRETAIRWALSSFIRAKDLEENPTIDGKSLREWDVGPTIHDDYTLENHNRVHPDYMNTITILTFQQVLYDWGGNSVPEALSFNCTEVYKNLKIFGFPDGNHIYPSGQDWRLHRNPDWVGTHLSMALMDQDPQAMRLYKYSLDAFVKMLARDPKLGAFLPHEFIFPSSQMQAPEKSLITPYLLNGILGGGPKPTAEKRLWKELAGTHVFETGKFVVYRTRKSISTFSWGQQVMGLVFPIQKDLLLNPFERSMIGMVSIPGMKEQPQVRDIEVIPQGDDLTICGRLLRAGGAVEQLFAFIALDDDRTLYIEKLILLDDSVAAELSLGTIPILNDKQWIYHDASRTVYHEGGKYEMLAQPENTDPMSIESDWFNIDNKLGVVVLNRTGKTMLYPKPYPARCRIQQLLHPNCDLLNRENPVAETAVLFLPAKSSQATRATARSVRTDVKNDEIQIALGHGKRVYVDLGTQTATVNNRFKPDW